MDEAELSKDQVATAARTLERLRAELREQMELSAGGARTVELDEPIGRLTRMDALQQQQMVQAQRRRHELRLVQIEAALAALTRGEYGLCNRCDDPIGWPRLETRPETPLCLDCQREIERRR